MWNQGYDPVNNWVLSTILGALPIIVLLGTLGGLRIKAHYSALLGLATALIIAIFIFGMPADKAIGAGAYGAAYGLFPIGWIILNVIFMYNLTNGKGLFKIMQDSLMTVTKDRRLQVLLIAFSFGAFFEGAAGFGTPIAVTAAILIGLGFGPLAASGLSLIANTAPVAYGALGAPILALAGVTGIDAMSLGAQTGRILPFFSIIVPFVLVWAFSGWKGLQGVWPATLVAGASFAIPQYLISNFAGPTLVDVVSAIISMACLIGFLFVWHPKEIWTSTALRGHPEDQPLGKDDGSGPGESVKPAPQFKPAPVAAHAVPAGQVALAAAGASVAAGGSYSSAQQEVARPQSQYTTREIINAWTPWVILSVVVFLWGYPDFKAWLNSISIVNIPVPGVDKLISRMPPVVTKPTPEGAVFVFNWLSFTGTGILISAFLSALLMRYSVSDFVKQFWATLVRVRFSLLTVSAMSGLGFVTRYGGLDATMALTFAKTGLLYPIFGTMLGWLGVALTGSDTSSNNLFGSLQTISAKVIGVSPTLMAAANSAGGVMGKMIDAQSIVVGSTATKWIGHEGDILRYVFLYSIVLAFLVGVVVFLQAYVFPFTLLAAH